MSSVSVIVPIFGVEKYIERCARSLFTQTIDDSEVEFIFVNDCTQDSSIKILEKIISEYPSKNVTILNHDSNMGLPAARQTGLQAATGNYVIHCDSDDWVEPDYCLKLYETAVSQNADIVVCGYRHSDWENGYFDNYYNDSLLSDPDQAVSAAIALKSSPYVWNKLVKRSLYNTANIIFPKRFLAEDWALTVQLALSAKKISFIKDQLYNYFINPASIQRIPTKELFMKKIAEEEENVRLVDDILKQRALSSKYNLEMTKRKARTKSMAFPYTNDIDCRKVWRRTFQEDNWNMLFNPELDWNYKKKHLLLLIGLYAPLRWFCHLVKNQN